MKTAVVSCLVTLMLATLCLAEDSPQASENDVAIELLLKRLLETKADSNAAVEKVAKKKNTITHEELNSKELMAGMRAVQPVAAGSPSSTRCLRDIEVFYTIRPLSKPPDNIILEARGASNDINYGISSQYNSYLVANWQLGKANAAFRISVTLENSAMPGYSDLGMGDGGLYYRYLKLSRISASPHPEITCVTEVALWRARSAAETPGIGWDGATGDINTARGGGILYLAFKLAY